MKQIIFICAIGTILFSGCTSKVKPWEKGVLAEKNMQLGGGDGPSKKVYEHAFTSKEGSSGGSGIGRRGSASN